MAPQKIEINNALIEKIQVAMKERKLKASKLSEAIGREKSYISSLQTGRMKELTFTELSTIFCVLYSITEEEAYQIIEAHLTEVKKADLYSKQSPSYILSNEIIDTTALGGLAESHWYEINSGYTQPELIDDMLNVLARHITDIYKKRPKEAVFMLSSIIRTIQFDPAFTTEVMSIPFYALKELSIDERKTVLDDIMNVFKEHAKRAGK